jgi:hypothetical protein
MANEKLVKKFRVSDDGEEKPCYGQMTVCWAKQEEAARKNRHRVVAYGGASRKINDRAGYARSLRSGHQADQ